MPIFVLKVPKGITHKQFKVFEFCQLEHLLEIMCYSWCDLDCLGKSSVIVEVWLGFDGLGVL